MRPIFLAAGLIIAAITFGGCATLPPSRPAAPGVSSAVIGRSVEDCEITCYSIGGEAAVSVMFIATIHGDEAAGTPLLWRLLREAQLQPPWMHDRRLLVLPLANPDGHAVERRTNARGVDLNRNFPASSFTARRRHGTQPLSEPESRALHDAIVRHRPDRIVSIHQPLACIDYDGPARELAQAMADAIDPAHRLRIRKLGAYPGSLGAFAGEDLGIPIVTVELADSDHLLDAETLWQRYGAMLIAGVAFEEALLPGSDRAAAASKD